MQTNILTKIKEKLGSQRTLARAIGVTDSAISQWTEIPIRRVLAVEALTGIPRHELRPDVYPPPAKPGKAA